MSRADGGRPGYETRDASLKLAAAIGIGLIVLTVGALFLMRGLFDVLEGAESRRQPEPLSLAAGTASTAPPEPRLESDPGGNLERLRAAEDAQLESYGWVEGQDGVVHIPIARAMELVAERGLPHAEGNR